MTTNVIAKIELDGLHNWPDAQGVFPEVGFLASMHRHKWHITVKKQVNYYVWQRCQILFDASIL